MEGRARRARVVRRRAALTEAPPWAGWAFETRLIHAGQSLDPLTGARAAPVYQSASFAFRDTRHAADLYSLSEVGFRELGIEVGFVDDVDDLDA